MSDRVAGFSTKGMDSSAAIADEMQIWHIRRRNNFEKIEAYITWPVFKIGNFLSPSMPRKSTIPENVFSFERKSRIRFKGDKLTVAQHNTGYATKQLVL